MNKDIRLSVEFFNHPKTKKLKRRLGTEAVLSLIQLWVWAAKNCPEGDFKNFDNEALAIAGNWAGDENEFINTLLKLKWLDGKKNNYTLHDWAEHNPWVIEARQRSEAGRLHRLARDNPKQYERLIAKGKRGITIKEYQQLKRPTSTLQAPHKHPCSISSTPAPAPAPIPIPIPEEKIKKETSYEVSVRSLKNPISGLMKENKTIYPKKIKNETAEDFHQRYMQYVRLTTNELLEKNKKDWLLAFPALNHTQACAHAIAWLEVNPNKRKKNISRFITNWLSRAQEKSGNNFNQPNKQISSAAKNTSEAVQAWLQKEKT